LRTYSQNRESLVFPQLLAQGTNYTPKEDTDSQTAIRTCWLLSEVGRSNLLSYIIMLLALIAVVATDANDFHIL
jgi:hypothetical protein